METKKICLRKSGYAEEGSSPCSGVEPGDSDWKNMPVAVQLLAARRTAPAHEILAAGGEAIIRVGPISLAAF
jgi:hypothetical protein